MDATVIDMSMAACVHMNREVCDSSSLEILGSEGGWVGGWCC